MSTTKNNRLVQDPPAELIQKALDLLILSNLSSFASDVEAARSMWRRFPELIEAPEFPEQLRAAFVEAHAGAQPDDACELSGEEVLKPNYCESLLPEAVDVARHWIVEWKRCGGQPVEGGRLCARIVDMITKVVASHEDAKFLSELGISGEVQ